MVTKPLVTLTEIKSFVKTSGTTMDDKYTLLASSATELIAQYIRRGLEYGEYTTYIDSLSNIKRSYESDLQSNSDVVANKFSVFPLSIDANETVSVYYDPYCRFGDTSLVSSDDYEVEDASSGIIRYWFPTVAGDNTIKVVCHGGIPVGDTSTDPAGSTLSFNAPSDLKIACITQVAFMVTHILEKQNIGVKEQRTSGDNSIITAFSRQGILCPECVEMINKYKRWVMRG